MSTRAQLDSWIRTLAELGPRQREVLDVLMHGGKMGATQIADRVGKHVYVVRPRITELAKMGVIHEAGERWEPRTQRHEAVWMVTPHDNDGQMRMAI